MSCIINQVTVRYIINCLQVSYSPHAARSLYRSLSLSPPHCRFLIIPCSIESHLYPKKSSPPSYPASHFSISARTLLKDIKWRTTSRLFLLKLRFWFDQPFPYVEPCLVLVIISSATDLSTSKEKWVQNRMMGNVGDNEPKLLPTLTRSTRFQPVYERPESLTKPVLVILISDNLDLT